MAWGTIRVFALAALFLVWRALVSSPAYGLTAADDQQIDHGFATFMTMMLGAREAPAGPVMSQNSTTLLLRCRLMTDPGPKEPGLATRPETWRIRP